MHIIPDQMAASDLYVPDSYEGIMPLQVDDAVGDEEASSQEPIKSIATSTEQTSNIEKKKKKKKKKRTRASLDGLEDEEKIEKKKKKKKKKRTTASLDGLEDDEEKEEQVVGINGPGKEIQQAVDDEKQVKAEELVKVAAASSTPLEQGVADMNKSNTKSRSSSSKGITWNHSDEIVILSGLISCKEKGQYESNKECYAYIRSLLKQGDLKQIKDKVKSLKRKYKTFKAKNMEEGSHDMKLFKLSKLYWGKLEHENENDEEKEKEETVLVQPGEKEIVDVEMTSNDVLVQPGEKEIVDVEMTSNDGDDESKPKLSGVLRRGLAKYFQSEGFDHRWVKKHELEELENKWKTYKIAEAISNKEQAHFLQAFTTYTLRAHEILGYQND